MAKDDEPSAYASTSVDAFPDDDYSDAETYHESTKLTRINGIEVAGTVERLRRDPKLSALVARSYKNYEGAARVLLPPADLGTMTLATALRRRRSPVSPLSGGPLALSQLSALLYFTYGALERRPFPGGERLMRPVPSAGGLYPIEIYPVVQRVEGCPAGIYHYSVPEHALAVLQATDDVGRELAHRTPYPELIQSAAVIFALTAVFPRSLFKYRFRGYRFVQNDVGALTQNLYLTGTALGLGTCAVGGFYDDEVGELLGIDNVQECVLLLFVVGPLGSGESDGAPHPG
jgi:SagB-type dehydrogenase family enzyme